jgi:hypothetical protein
MLHDKAFFSDGVWPGAAEEAWRIRSAAMHAEQGVDAEPPDHFGMVHEQHRQMEDMLFADDLRDRLRKARLVVRDAGVERIHAAFEKLLGIAIQRLVEPEPEHEEEKDRTA